jgi:hypothetical protein
MDFIHWRENKAKCLERSWRWRNMENTVHKYTELVILGNLVILLKNISKYLKRDSSWEISSSFLRMIKFSTIQSIKQSLDALRVVNWEMAGQTFNLWICFCRNKLSELVPYWMYKPGWQTILGRSTKATIEQNLIAQYKELSETLDANGERSCGNGKLFLERCWDLPYYGWVTNIFTAIFSFCLM